MFKLHGAPISNFYSIVKLTLLEKGLDFEEVLQAPSQDEAFLEKSPMGKIPVLEVREGFISETQVIVDFLDHIYPEIPLYPRDPYQRAMVRRLCHMSEIYLDIPSRPALLGILTGNPVSDGVKNVARQQLERGARGLARVASPGPWLAGSEFSMADIYVYYTLGLAELVSSSQLNMNLLDFLPGFAEWKSLVASREFIAEVDAGQQKAMADYLARLASEGNRA
jgi:Glutathione S-transferase